MSKRRYTRAELTEERASPRPAGPQAAFEAPPAPVVAPAAAVPPTPAEPPMGHDFSRVQIFPDRAADGPGGPAGGPADPVALREAVVASEGGGQPLDEGVRAPLEFALRTDLSGVSIHRDAAADGLATALDARAFTSGEHVFFREGSYNPGDRSGRELLAHELTHVVQQRAGEEAAAPEGVSQPQDAAEREARQVAQRALSPQPATADAPPDLSASAGIQRDIVDDVVLGARNLYHDVAEGIGVESPDEAESARLEAFIEHGAFGPQSLVPPTNIGGFDASFDPGAGTLLIEVRTGVNFIDGLAIDASNVITANNSDLNQAATDGMNLDPADRAAFVLDFQWAPDLEDVFLENLQARVEEAWSGQYFFACTRPGWESVFADVAVFVDVHRGAAGPDDHLQTTSYKVPDGGGYSVGAFVDSDRNDPNKARDQDPFNNELVMSSTDVQETPLDQSLLRKTVLFEHDSAVLSPDATATLRAFERDFQDANLDLTNPVMLEGHASAPGTDEHNERLAQARIDAVRNFLSGIGFTGISDRVGETNFGELGATEDAEWRRVDLIVGSGEGQLVASHEFGHVFGLADEYVSNDQNPGGSITGSGSAVGTVVGHDAMAKAIGTSGAVAENNDDIMSLGNTVRPKHYATFGWALAQVTGIDEWEVV